MRARRDRRGVAMILVLLALAVASALSAPFLASQSTSVAISRNVTEQSRARAIAESGLTLAIEYVRDHADWRASRGEGVWADGVPYAGGTFTIRGYDGRDADGDGDIEGDGSLSDDDGDPLTLIATGTHQGVTHRVGAVVRPIRRLVLIVPDPANLSREEAARRSMFRDEGWRVSLLAASADASSYDQAVEQADAVYIVGSVSAAAVNTRLNEIAVGVVSENVELADDMGLTAPGTSSRSGSSMLFASQSHPLIDPFSGRKIQFASSSQPINLYKGELSPGTTALATDPSTGDATMLAIDTGDKDFGSRFVVDGGTVVPDVAYSAKMTVLGAAMSLKMKGKNYQFPVTVQLQAGSETYEPFGPFDEADNGDVNDDNNPRQFVLPDELPADTPLAVKGRSWIDESQTMMTVESAEDSVNVRVLRDGDPTPDMEGYQDQAAAADFLTSYMDTETGTITLAGNQAIYLFELSRDMDKKTVDFQDLVVLVSLSRDRSRLMGQAPARRLFLPWSGGLSPAELTADGRELLTRAFDWSRNGSTGGYAVRWVETR